MSFEESIEQIVRRVVREELARVPPATKSRAQVAELYSPDEVAETLGLGPDCIRTWCASGKMPARKIGGVWRVRRSDLEAFIEREKKPEAAPDPREVALSIVNGSR